ncbi:MAG: carbon-nitrogen hydrolase family protein [Proteobacteria bacterium]|nr:carbon-nitrogen hydrolase family protein [Pseudomonadota bacterium]
MRLAAIQMNSGADVDANLRLTDRLLSDAAADDCKMAVLPENFALMPKRSRDKVVHAEEPGSGPIQKFLSDAARRHGIWIIAGSIPLVAPEPEKVFGACPVYDADGIERACYRKIHLFDVKLPDRDESYQESWSMCAGTDPVTVESPIGKIGLTICYDLRFPELYRRLVDDGATAFTVPAAFTSVTGEAHWQLLLRARAIENLAYVVAAGQYGDHPDKRSTYGHSMIIDPWGTILAEQAAGDCHIAADIDPELPSRLRSEFPALANRRL